MPSTRRLRVITALSTMMLVLTVPQLAGARSTSSRPQAKATSHRHDSKRHDHRHHHKHHKRPHKHLHKHNKHHSTSSSSSTTTTTTTRPRPEPQPTTTTTTRPRPEPQPTTTTTTRPRPEPQPEPQPQPGLRSECLTRNPLAVVTSSQDTRFKPSLDSAMAVDARTANWTQVDDWPVSVTGSAPLCWNGGRIMGTYGSATSWETFHHTGGFSFNNPNSIIENVRVHNYGDSINVREGATNWQVRAAHTTMTHDDCLQNDYLTSGVISDSFFDGCYVGISTRPSSNNSSSDGRTETVTLKGSLLRLQPMPTVYKGPAPGHGGFFKWDDTGRSPKLALFNNVFRVDQTPNHGSLGLPSGYKVACSGNTIVWLGSGSFPEAASWLAQCPDTRIVTLVAAWDNAAAMWKASH